MVSFSDLPVELATEILHYVDVYSRLYNVQYVSKLWQSIVISTLRTEFRGKDDIKVNILLESNYKFLYTKGRGITRYRKFNPHYDGLGIGIVSVNLAKEILEQSIITPDKIPIYLKASTWHNGFKIHRRLVSTGDEPATLQDLHNHMQLWIEDMVRQDPSYGESAWGCRYCKDRLGLVIRLKHLISGHKMSLHRELTRIDGGDQISVHVERLEEMEYANWVGRRVYKLRLCFSMLYEVTNGFLEILLCIAEYKAPPMIELWASLLDFIDEAINCKSLVIVDFSRKL